MSRFAPLSAVALTLLAAHGSPALAASACTDNVGWSPAPKQTLPTHARVVFFNDGRGGSASDDSKIVASIGKKAVKTKITHLKSAPYDLTIIEIDSDRTGELSVGFGDDDLVTYTVGKVSMPKQVAGKVARFQREYRHTSVREKYDGLSLHLPPGTPAVTAHIKIRRDDKAKWSELDVPITPDDATKVPSIWIGELGCVSNYTVALLEAGVDLDVTVTLADGTTRAVTVPAHVALPKN